MFFTDKRVQKMNEIITGIKLVKLYAWENSFAESVAKIRDSEVGELRKSVLMMSLNTFISNLPSVLSVFISLITYYYTKHDLKASTVFVTISLFQTIRFPLLMMFFGGMTMGQLKIARQRIETFVKRPSAENHLVKNNVENPQLILENVSFKQSGLKGKENVFELKDLSFSMEEKGLLLVVG